MHHGELMLAYDVQGVWSRALGLPIERPKSVTMDWIEDKVTIAQPINST